MAHVDLVNAAIAGIDSRVKMYVAAQGLEQGDVRGEWSSLCRDQLKRLGIGDGDLAEIEVEAVTLETLAERVGVDRIGLLIVDAEGYDDRCVACERGVVAASGPRLRVAS